MGLFDLFSKDNLKETVFLKEDSSAQKQLEQLNTLLQTATDSNTVEAVSQDIRMVKAGISGENNIAFELKNSMIPMLVLHDLNIEWNGLKAQIDYIVIHKNFLLVIESKKLNGDIEINSKGEFIRYFKNNYGKVYKKEGIYSPVVQNERHVEILKKMLLETFTKSKPALWDEAINSVVVIANEKTVINDKYAKKEIKESIIKYDHLKDYLKRLALREKSFLFKEESMYLIAQKLMEHHKEECFDYTKKYSSAISQPEENKQTAENTELYQQLKNYRLNKSRADGVKPYFIFNNNQLDDIIRVMPKSIPELMTVSGFAQVKCEKYGNGIIEIIKKYS